jgi:hypothetical protein
MSDLSLQRVGPTFGGSGTASPFRADITGAQVITDAHGRLYEASRAGNLYVAHAIVTAPVIFSTAAGTGGPLLWNGTTNKLCSILKIGLGVTVVTTVAAALGLTGNTGQTSAPTSTTAIDSSKNLYIGGQASGATVFRVGTPTNAGNFFLPFAQLHTGALTVDTSGVLWIDIDGAVTVPPNAWCSVAASATATTAVCQISMIWEELPFLV